MMMMMKKEKKKKSVFTPCLTDDEDNGHRPSVTDCLTDIG